jgi:5-methylthioadenosine/S-adenosylhomocysteine deaminase
MPTLFHNVAVFTGDAVGLIEDAGVLVEAGDIVWIGPLADLPPGAGPIDRRDLGGRLMIPGLINKHAHGGLSLHRGACDDGDLFEWAAAIAPHTSTLTLEECRYGCLLAITEMVRNGITTACDCARYGAGIFASVASRVGMRSLSGALANSPVLRRAGRPNWPLALEETEEAIAAHAGDDLARFYLGAHSPYNCTPELLVEVKAAARRLGLPFVIHAAEHPKETAIVRERHGTTPIRHLARLGLIDRGTILAHCIWVDEEEIGMLAASGAGVAHNPVSNAKLASGVAPVPALRRAGVPVGLGTDSTISNNSLDLFQEMKLSVLLQRATRRDAHAAVAADAIAMATREGARVLGWEDRIGSLAAGKAADFVVLDLDHPLGRTLERVVSDLVYRAAPQHVCEVVVAGRTIYGDGRFTNVGPADLGRRFPPSHPAQA